jgi:hypothetical protein
VAGTECTRGKVRQGKIEKVGKGLDLAGLEVRMRSSILSQVQMRSQWRVSTKNDMIQSTFVKDHPSAAQRMTWMEAERAVRSLSLQEVAITQSWKKVGDTEKWMRVGDVLV